MSEIRIARDYPYPVITVWRALTDPALVPLWTSTGQGGRPEGFKTEVGTRFRFIGKPFPGWDGIVRCEVLAVDEPTMLRYDWRNKETDQPTVVTNTLAAIPGGTRLTWEQTGFRGIEGLFMSRLLGRVRRKMLTEGLPPVLADIGEDGRLRPGSSLRARSLTSRNGSREAPRDRRRRSRRAVLVAKLRAPRPSASPVIRCSSAQAVPDQATSHAGPAVSRGDAISPLSAGTLVSSAEVHLPRLLGARTVDDRSQRFVSSRLEIPPSPVPPGRLRSAGLHKPDLRNPIRSRTVRCRERNCKRR